MSFLLFYHFRFIMSTFSTISDSHRFIVLIENLCGQIQIHYSFIVRFSEFTHNVRLSDLSSLNYSIESGILPDPQFSMLSFF